MQPSYDDLAGILDDCVPLESCVDIGVEDVSKITFLREAEVDETHGGDRVVANLGQSFPTFGVGTQNVPSPGQPIQAAEPLADQSRALQRRPLGNQRIAHRQP
jgi:hypothetical protein